MTARSIYPPIQNWQACYRFRPYFKEEGLAKATVRPERTVMRAIESTNSLKPLRLIAHQGRVSDGIAGARRAP